MKKLEYTVSFTTPAFLGNAEQQAQWRTPPFKALLRQWWRVVKANELLRAGVSSGELHAELLRRENELFGAAADDGKGGSHRSLVRLRLSSWNPGNLKQWPVNEPKVTHPEVKFPVGSEIYLGYGPLGYDKISKTTQLGEIRGSNTKRTAIDVNSSARLCLMFPASFEKDVCGAMQLAAWFGSLGSRSRNAWGAIQIEGDGIGSMDGAKLAPVLRPFIECLNLDWPHAIGSIDGQPAIWKTKASGSWREVMKELARIKIEFRTQFKFVEGGPHHDVKKRQVLAYPVTKHNHASLGTDARLANQIRFKVIPSAGGKLSGQITHLPCKLPNALFKKLSAKDQHFVRTNELAIWQQVHTTLNELCDRL